ncbi:MAG: hypothetical protein AAFY39_18215 [Pseudomonadota bacterium]
MRISYGHIALGAISIALMVALSFGQPTQPRAPNTLTAPERVAVHTLEIADAPIR